MQCTRNRYSKADNIKSILILLADIHTYIYIYACVQANTSSRTRFETSNIELFTTFRAIYSTFED